ncbi:hypothetical protein CAGGBEG34_440012 [Candidatus Glomeribacter gigasporarum BEG34]|uniref:Uncharacterized protein n=1 Tax=Candidatus Glomeribacter gigasporarum BEG34 TaxID=1070319 RepID=G2JBH1_9BURK|nr:hypothetical protein CAGGBEG34_440012 [Candidatus Glomeribacter gigasporarum BEG34]
MAWTINYTETAKSQLKKLDKQTARRIVDYMEERISPRGNPRSIGKVLTGPLIGFGATALAITESSATFRMTLYAFS